jgi:hypothetical protein
VISNGVFRRGLWRCQHIWVRAVRVVPFR